MQSKDTFSDHYDLRKIGLFPSDGRVSAARANMLHRSIPADTRKPFQRMMGDPMPGRSAYDQMVRDGAAQR